MAVVAPSSTSPSSGNLDPDKSDASNSSPAMFQDAASNPAPDSASAAADAPPPPSNPNPNPAPQINPAPPVAPPPPPAVASFRPLGAPPVPQYSTIPNPGFQGVIQPPGVTAAPVPIMPPGGVYPTATPGQPMSAVPMAYGQVPNGYPPHPMAPPHGPMGMMPPPGMPRYPYAAMIRPGFPPRTIPPMGMMPQVSRPLIPGVRGVPPAPLVIRPIGPVAPPAEKPQTTVYVGKIAPTVDNDFLLSVLKLCGPVKSWKRAQDPSDGTPKGFGFCEFESADGVLRSLRLLSKLSIDGQELVLNINQATREYLHRCVEKKTEAEKLKEAESGCTDKENGSTADDEPRKEDAEEGKKDSEEAGNKQNQENSERFGIVTEEDREADKDALEKLTVMIEDRIKNKPLPPPPPVPAPADAPGKSNSEVPSRSRDGDSDVDITKNEDKISDVTSSENKAATENDKPETSSPDRGRRHDSRNKERDRERDLKRDKERELEKAERERERERLRRERERELKLKEAERFYKERLKDWESREREKEQQRKLEKEREKERERERRKEILRLEDEMDDDDSRRRRRRSDMIEDKRRKRKREKEDDLDDRVKEEEEIVDAKRRAVEAQSIKDELKSPIHVSVEIEKHISQEEVGFMEDVQAVADHDHKIASTNVDIIGDENCRKSSTNEEVMLTTSETKQSNIIPARKLGFGLIGSGKRTAVLSVFHDEDDENVDEKKMRPLVPIDYSTEELQAIQTNSSGAQANLVAAAEFAKHISGVNSREEKFEVDKERNRHSGERSSLRERNRNDGDNGHCRDDSREKIHKSSNREKDHDDKPKTENRKLLDAKQLIDMIPKTKEELFIYEINWEIYDKHKLHERMKPWISKKITEFLGEEEETLVEYIVSSTKEHVPASQMLEILQAIFEDEAEMFVLKMWRMLIFEIKKVESGLSGKAKS